MKNLSKKLDWSKKIPSCFNLIEKVRLEDPHNYLENAQHFWTKRNIGVYKSTLEASDFWDFSNFPLLVPHSFLHLIHHIVHYFLYSYSHSLSIIISITFGIPYTFILFINVNKLDWFFLQTTCLQPF